MINPSYKGISLFTVAINNIYTISSDLSFLDILARFILAKHSSALELCSVLVLLPNYKSAEVLQDIISQSSNLLPKIKPIGSMDPEALIFAGFDIKPPVSAIQRKMMLIDLMIQTLELEPSLALSLLAKVEHILDEMQRQQLLELTEDFDELLGEVIHSYRTLLREQEFSDIIEYRNSIIDGYAALWLQETPHFPIIAAGSTASQPATRNLLKTIVDLPSGMVVLPNLALHMSDKEWDAIDETHHQYNLKFFLEYIGANKQNISCLD